MIDWQSSKNAAFWNPKFSSDLQKELLGLLASVEGQFQSHLFLLTSGTTAQSSLDFKWVAIEKNALLASGVQVNRHLESNSTDVWLHPLPNFHVGGLGIWARSYLSGAKVLPMVEGWSVSAFLRIIESHSVTLTAFVPTQVYDLVNLGIQSPPSLRAAVVGGGALSPVLFQRALQLGWPLLPSYGMTETGSQIATAALNSQDGLLEILPHLEVQETSERVLKVRGKSLFSSYIYRRNDQVICDDPKKNGWFYSQDRGQKLGNQLKILGRLGDFVKIGGESVELEKLRVILDQVQGEEKISADIALLAVPDERLGHVIHLVSDARLSLVDATQLMERYNACVLGFEKVRKWHSLTRLPRTELGKLIASACLREIEGS